ncbi:unnamed protein product [Colias eurytheme]|nr:unnamed protein product [Colias eurytheme]
MHSMFFVVVSLALLAACVCAPSGDVIQHIPPNHEATQSATEKEAAVSGAAVENVGSSKPLGLARERRDLGGDESDLLPSDQNVASPFGESSLDGRGRIRVLPAFLG